MPLDLHPYRFRLRTVGELRFPEFPGPALRGALGDDREVYETFFRPPPVLPQKRFADPPRPIALHPRFGAGTYGPGSRLELDVVLAGTAAAGFPALLRGLARVGERGVGPARTQEGGGGTFAIERVDARGPHGPVPVVTPDGWVRLATAPWRIPADLPSPPPAPAAHLTLHLRTPTLVRRASEPRGSLELRDLASDLLRRLSLLSQAYGDGPVYTRDEERAITDAAAAARVEDAAVRWMDVPRFSRQQRRPMTFGGWMGWVRYAEVPAEVVPLLHAAPLLQVGKHTAFGFGAVRIAPPA